MTLVGAALKRPALAALLIGAVVLAPRRTGDRAQDRPAQHRTAPPGRPGPPGRRTDRPYDRTRLRRAVRGRRRQPRRPDHRRQEPRRARPLAAARSRRSPGVQAGDRPGAGLKSVEPLREPGNAAARLRGNIGPVKQLGRLGRNLGGRQGASRNCAAGISEASAGAGLLAQGSDRAGEGAQHDRHRPRPRRPAAANERCSALDKFASGTKRLAQRPGTGGAGQRCS